MKQLSSYLLIASIVLTTATAAFPAPATPVVKDDIKGTVITPAKPAEKTATAPAPAVKPVVKKIHKKIVHKSKRAPRHSSSKNDLKAEAAPGERLSIMQVMEILKTNRNLSGKNLSGLRLVGFDLTKCNLKGADLNKADLERADLEESNLELADFSGANMKMTDLRITGLKGAKLDGAILDGAIWPDGTVCEKGSTGLCREHPDKFGSN